MAIKITKGNASDLSAVSGITKGLYGKLFGNIDVGCMQINLKHHPEALPHLWQVAVLCQLVSGLSFFFPPALAVSINATPLASVVGNDLGDQFLYSLIM